MKNGNENKESTWSNLINDKKYVPHLFGALILVAINFGFIILLFFAPESNVMPFLGYMGTLSGGTITVAATILIYNRLFKQNKDIAKTQKEAADLEKFEAKFMMMINIHRENVNQMKINKVREDPQGRKVEDNFFGQECFALMVNELKAIFKQNRVNISNEKDVESKKKVLRECYHAFFYGLKHLPNKYLIDLDEYKTLKLLYDAFLVRNQGANPYVNKMDRSLFMYEPFEGYQAKTGHCFRHLWQTVNFVHSYDVLKTFEERKFYMKMLRAQLSNDEQVIIALNALSDLGKPWMEVIEGENKGLLEKYELIKNISEEFFKEDENFNLIDCFNMKFEYKE